MINPLFLVYLYDKLSVDIPVCDHQEFFHIIMKIPQFRPVLKLIMEDFIKFSKAGCWFDDNIVVRTVSPQVRKVIQCTVEKFKMQKKDEKEMEQLLKEIDQLRNGSQRRKKSGSSSFSI